jgi:hypothetical protein
VVFARQFLIERGKDGVLRVLPGDKPSTSSSGRDMTTEEFVRWYLFGSSVEGLVGQYEKMVQEHGATGSDFFYAPNDYANVGSCY